MDTQGKGYGKGKGKGGSPPAPSSGGGAAAKALAKEAALEQRRKAEALAKQRETLDVVARAENFLHNARTALAAFKSAEAAVEFSLAPMQGWQSSFQEAQMELLRAGDTFLDSLQSAAHGFTAAGVAIDRSGFGMPEALESVAAGNAETEALFWSDGERAGGLNSTTEWAALNEEERMIREPLWATGDDAVTEGPADSTRVVCISDTHGKHRWLDGAVPHGDILIHAGDATMYGSEAETLDVVSFLGELDHTHKIFIAGNHDISLHSAFYKYANDSGKWPGDHPAPVGSIFVEDVAAFRKRFLSAAEEAGVTYLEDETLTVDGIVFYGSPWQPFFKNWAFQLHRGVQSQRVWQKIPGNCDIVITHGPALGRQDGGSTARMIQQGGGGGDHCGCGSLLAELRRRVVPRVHVSGHVHESAGVCCDNSGIAYANASTCDVSYMPTNAPIVFDIPRDRSLPARFLRPHIEWTTAQVAAWLREEGFPHWASALEVADVDGAGLVAMNMLDLRGWRDIYLEQAGDGLCKDDFTKDEENVVRGILRLRAKHYR